MPFIKKSFGSDLSTIDRYVQAQRWGSLRTLMEQRSIRHIDPYIALFNAYKAFNNHLRQFSPERYFKKAFSEYKDIPLNERDCLHESYSMMRNSMSRLKGAFPDGISPDLSLADARALHPDERTYLGLMRLFDRMCEIDG